MEYFKNFSSIFFAISFKVFHLLNQYSIIFHISSLVVSSISDISSHALFFT